MVIARCPRICELFMVGKAQECRERVGILRLA